MRYSILVWEQLIELTVYQAIDELQLINDCHDKSVSKEQKDGDKTWWSVASELK